MNVDFKDIAKSDPEFTLGEHTKDVITEAEHILSEFRNHVSKFDQISDQPLKEELIEACNIHDYGKSHPRWQKHVSNDNLINVRLRHEFQSIRYIEEKTNEDISDKVKVSVLSHHNKLLQRAKDRWFEDIKWDGETFDFKDYWNEMDTLEKNVPYKLSFDNFIKEKFKFDTVRGFLQLADRRASQLERPGVPNPIPLKRFRRIKFPYKSKRKIQKEVERREIKNKDVVCIRSETGSGKTLASLLWAQSKDVDRVIFTTPTRFTGSSLYEDLTEEVSRNVGLYHSNAGSQIYKERRGGEKLRMARKFLFPVNVTTIDQVLSCIVGRREDDHLRFSNLCNSCIIIDEVDFYDEVMQANIELLVEVADIMDIPIMVMSATLPDAHTSLYSTGNKNPEIIDTTKKDRSFTIQNVRKVREENIIDDFNKVLKNSSILETERGIIYANTVNRSQRYYDILQGYRDDVVLYHSRFTSKDRANTENEIKNMLGENGEGGIAIMTQIGEMSLNISSVDMITELCPIDRLAQRTGRNCRFDEENDGDLNVIIPYKEGGIYPAPYGNFNPNDLEWIPFEELLETKEWVEKNKGKSINKLDLKNSTNKVYDEELKFDGIAKENKDLYYDAIEENWIIVPDLSEFEEDEDRWRTRIIPPNTFVIVRPSKLKEEYDSMDEWLEHKKEISVSIPTYIVESSERIFRKMITIDDDLEENLSVLKYPEEDYSSEYGLTIDTDIGNSTTNIISWILQKLIY